MVKESSQKDKQPHIKNRRKKTLKRKSYRKELKRTKKRKHDEEGGGFFDYFRKNSTRFKSKDDENSTLNFSNVLEGEEQYKKQLTDLMTGFENNGIKIYRGSYFKKETFWIHFSRIYGLTDDWNSLVSKSRLRYLLEFKFFRQFMGGNFDYPGHISDSNMNDNLQSMRRFIALYIQEHLTSEQLKRLLTNNPHVGRNGIFGWGSFTNTSFTKKTWGVEWSEIKNIKSDGEKANILIKNEEKLKNDITPMYKKFKILTLILIYVYQYYSMVRKEHLANNKIASGNSKKKTPTADGGAPEDQEIVQITRGMEKLLQTGVFKDELLDNSDFRIFFMSYIEEQKIRSGIWINYNGQKGDMQEISINLYLLTNNIANFRFLDCLYTDEYKIDMIKGRKNINIESNKLTYKDDYGCPTEVFPEIGNKINKDYFIEDGKQKENMNLRGISFYPMRCPSRGVKQLFIKCRQIAFVNQIVSRNVNSIMTLPHNMEEFSLIIPEMFASYEKLTLENIKKSGYTKIKLINHSSININPYTNEVTNHEQIFKDLSLSLTREFADLRVTINNIEKCISNTHWNTIKGNLGSDTDEDKKYMIIDDARIGDYESMFNYFNEVITMGSFNGSRINYLFSKDELPFGYKKVDGEADKWMIIDGGKKRDFELVLVNYFIGRDQTWTQVWGGNNDEYIRHVRTLLSLIHMKDYDAKLFNNHENVSNLKKVGKKLSEISQKYFSHTAPDSAKNSFESYKDDMKKLRDLIYEAFGREKEATHGGPTVWEFSKEKIIFNFKDNQNVDDKDRFLTVEELRGKVLKSSFVDTQEVKVGIAFKETGESTGTLRKYYRKKVDFPAPIPNNNEFLNTFMIRNKDVFFRTNLIADTDTVNLNIITQEQEALLNKSLKQKFISLSKDDINVKKGNYQMFMFLYEDNEVKKKKTSSTGSTITEEPRMSFWFKEES